MNESPALVNKTLLQETAAHFGTPCYLFDLQSLAARVRQCQAIVGDTIGLCYSIKANPFLTGAMDASLSLLEVCSPGEFQICRSLGIAPDHILMSGVSKTHADIEEALDYGVRTFTCESLLHVRLLNEAAAVRNLTLPVLLRLTAGSQFGMDETDLLSVIRERETFPHLAIEGIHYFSGTQRKKLTDQKGELTFLREFCSRVSETLGFTIRKIEYGTGLYYPYFANEDHTDTLAPLRELAPSLQALSQTAQLTIEMGRFFASECGTFLTTVQDTKINRGQRYAILDGGIHHLNYYGGSMGMRLPCITQMPHPVSDSQAPEHWMLCGALCTTADVLVRDYPTPSLTIGDLLAFHHCGAYSVTEAPALFLSRDMPAIVLYDGKSLTEVRKMQPSWVLNLPVHNA